MATVFVKDPVGWNKEFNLPGGMVAKDLNQRGRRLQQMAVRQVGKRTGRLAGSINHVISVDFRGLNVRVGSDNRIARLHHDGSRAHVIRPRKAKVLRFVQNGQVRYAHRVFHPGTKPNRFLTDNLIKVVVN